MRTSPTGICKQRRGFTLLELLVAIFIISLFAAIVFPSFSDLGEDRLRAEARKVAALLRYLNDNAVATKEQYSLEFDFRNSSLTWKGPEGEKSEQFRTLAWLSLPSRGKVHDGQVTVFFGPLGAPEPLEVSLLDHDHQMRVVFNPLSGRAKIYPHE